MGGAETNGGRSRTSINRERGTGGAIRRGGDSACSPLVHGRALPEASGSGAIADSANRRHLLCGGIFTSLKTTWRRSTGSYFFSSSFPCCFFLFLVV